LIIYSIQQGEKVMRKYFALLLMVFCVAMSAEGVDVSPDVMQLHQDAIVCDLHADTTIMIRDMGYDMSKRHHALAVGPAGFAPFFSDIDIPRAREGGLDLMTLAICVHPFDNHTEGSAERTRESFAALERMFSENSRDIALARTASEAREIIATGRLGAIIGIEGGHHIEDEMRNLIEFYNRGARYLTLSHSHGCNWSVAAGMDDQSSFKGLTEFGREVVREMARLGMMVDLAHCSVNTFWAALEEFDGPLLCTHNGARALADHPRNLYDDQIRAVCERGGVIGAIYHTGYLDVSGHKDKDVRLVVDHIDHMVKVGGIECVALGSDFDGGVTMPKDLSDASKLPNITAELVRRGYSKKDIRKILGENFLRVFAAVTGK
jgi:membrane dipeptidase